MSQLDRTELLEKALALVRGLAEHLALRGLAPEYDGVLSARSAMTLALTHDERSLFFKCLAALGRATYHAPMGDDTLRGLLQDALLRAIEGPPADSPPRVAAAVQTLRTELASKPRRWNVAYCVQWMDQTELPFRYQDVLFVPVDKDAVSEALSIQPGVRLNDAIDQFLPDERQGMAVAASTVEAFDEASARVIALNFLHDAIDELTGFAALTRPLTPPVVSDVFNGIHVSLVTLVTSSSDEGTLYLPTPLPAEVVRPKRIFTILEQHLAPSRIKALLTKAPDGDLSTRIRSAVRFIGRAQQCRFENRVADSFLYFVVALEALLGKKDYKDSIGYQLRMRVAHLVGRDSDERDEIERDIAHLYKIRSKLLHSGAREVRPPDLTSVGSYAVRSVVEVLIGPPIKDFRKFDQLEEWFRQKLLA